MKKAFDLKPFTMSDQEAVTDACEHFHKMSSSLLPNNHQQIEFLFTLLVSVMALHIKKDTTEEQIRAQTAHLSKAIGDYLVRANSSRGE